jgi:hypothetical protein
MAKDLSGIRKALKSGLETDQQARKLAKEAAAVLDPKAAATAKKLEGAFRSFPMADCLRGDSKAARKSALDLLDDAEDDSSQS